MNHPSLSNLELLEEAAVFLNPKVDVLDQVFELFCSLRKAKLLSSSLCQVLLKQVKGK